MQLGERSNELPAALRSGQAWRKISIESIRKGGLRVSGSPRAATEARMELVPPVHLPAPTSVVWGGHEGRVPSDEGASQQVSGAQRRERLWTLRQSGRAPWRQREGRVLGRQIGVLWLAAGNRDTHFLPRYLISSHQLLLGVPTAFSSCSSAAPRGGSGTSRISRIKATASRQGMIWGQGHPGRSELHTTVAQET